MNKFKKALAVLLVVLMLATAIPFSSFAATEGEETVAVAVQIQVFDISSSTKEKGDEYFCIPDFSYKVTFDDGETIIGYSSDADPNLTVSHNQKEVPWEPGSQTNLLYVTYQNVKTQVVVDVVDENYEYYDFYRDGDGIIIEGMAPELSGTVSVPASLDGKPVIGIESIGRNITDLKLPATLEYIDFEYIEFNYLTKLKSISVNSKNEKYSSENGILYNKSKTEILAIPYAKTGTVTLPKTVKTIGSTTAPKITIKTHSDSKYFTFKGGVIYNNNKTEIIYVNKSVEGSYTMPSTVKKISEGAFANCKKLTSVKMSNSVTTLAYSAFSSCSSLENITLPNKLEKIGGYAFEDCSKLQSIKLPSTLNKIETSAFYCAGLTAITFPNSLEIIDNTAFYNNKKLKTVRFGTGIKKIGSDSFDNCSKIEKVYVPSLSKWCNIKFVNALANPLYFADKLYVNAKYTPNVVIPKKVKKISAFAFCNFQGLKSITFNDDLQSIEQRAFDNTPIKKVVITNKVTSIGKSAFARCGKLASITLGKSVKTIAESAFMRTAIKKITIPNSVKEISNHAFCDCKNLKSLNIGSGLKDLSAMVFSNCNKLDDVTISAKNKNLYTDSSAIYNKKRSAIVMYYKPDQLGYSIKSGIKNIDIPAFSQNDSASTFKTFIIPNSVTNISYDNFFSCEKLTNLTTVTLPTKAKGIGDYAFINSKKIVSVTIPKSVKKIGYNAFDSKIKHVFYAGSKADWKKIYIFEGNEDLLNAKIHYNSKGCKHKYSKGADLTCNVCGYFEILPTTRKVNGKTIYFVNGKKAKSVTGVVKIDGKEKFVKKGVVTKYLDNPKVKVASTKQGVKVSWSKVTAAKTYTVYRGVYSGGKWKEYKACKTTKGTSFIDKVKPGTKVKYKVLAYNGQIKSNTKSGTYIKHTAPSKK